MKTGVLQVKAGPSCSSAAKEVTSFMTDAGLTATPARCDSRGAALPSTSATTSVTASGGSLALASAALTSGGSWAWAPVGPARLPAMVTASAHARSQGRQGARSVGMRMCKGSCPQSTVSPAGTQPPARR